MPRTLAPIVVVLAMLAGCPGPASTAPTSAPTAAEPAPPAAPAAALSPQPAPAAPAPAPVAPKLGDGSVAGDMQRHDELAEKARAAVVAGDLEGFRVAMDYEAMQPLPGDEPAKGAIFVERAEAAAVAADLPAAAAALGSVAASCAGCHRAHPRDRFAPSGFEEEGDADLPERMQLHWWATDALWQGLVGPSDAAWDVGAKTLADPSLKAVPGFPAGSTAAGFADALRAAATAGRAAKGDEARGKALGKVLATCAGCHTALKAGPGLESE